MVNNKTPVKECRNYQVGYAVALNDRVNNHNKGACRATNLNFAATKD